MQLGLDTNWPALDLYSQTIKLLPVPLSESLPTFPKVTEAHKWKRKAGEQC